MNSTFNISDQDLANQLHKLKQQNIKKQLQIQRIKATDPQLLQMQKKIQASYTTKQRCHQIAQKQTRQLQDKIKQSLNEAMVLKHAQQEQERIRKQNIRHAQKQKQNQFMLANQMADKKKIELEAYEQYLRQKQQVDKQVQDMIRVQIAEKQKKQTDKKQLYRDMVRQFKQKEMIRQMRKKQAKQELEKIEEYLRKVDGKNIKAKQQKIAQQRKREAIYLELKMEDDKRKKQQEQLEQLRYDYYQLVNQKKQQQKDQQAQQKKQAFREMLIMAQAEQKQLKRKQKQNEQYLQKGFRIKMLQRLGEQQRIDQLTAERKRFKMRQHQKQVERLWTIKLDQYRQAQEEQQREIEAMRLAEMWKAKIVEEEKEKLLREHAVNLGGFLHPDLIPRAKQIMAYNQHPQATGYLHKYIIQ